MQSEEYREKSKTSCLEKYGVENVQQNADLAQKFAATAYRCKDYAFPSGNIVKIQGYENYLLDALLEQGVAEDDIITRRSKVPEIWYADSAGKRRRYFVDCFIPSQNKCIEVKSTWTMRRVVENNILLKQQATKDAGYECEIWVYNPKGELVECHK